MGNNQTLYIMSYGDEKGHEKGMVELSWKEDGTIDRHCFSVEGKANFALFDGDRVIIPVKETKGNYLYWYEQRQLQGKFPVRYFYSHGVVGDEGCYYFASYEDGIDAIFDWESKQEVSIMEHHRSDCDQKAKCHYIGWTPDHQYVYTIENGLQQIYLYQIKEKQFVVHDVLQFPLGENIRLMPFSVDGIHAYLNTEYSNVIYTLCYEEGTLLVQDSLALLPSVEHSFSGGLALSPDGTLLCVTMRNENALSCYSIARDGTLSLLDKVTCGNMPRDVRFLGHQIIVSCTYDQVLECYELQQQRLVKIVDLPIAQPITFV